VVDTGLVEVDEVVFVVATEDCVVVEVVLDVVVDVVAD